MKALPLSPQFSSLKPDSSVYMDAGEGLRQFKIESIKGLNRYAVISLQDITDRETAFRYRGSVIHMKGEAVVLKEGEFLHDQIIGLSVFTTEGKLLGTVEEIFSTGSNDVYIVKNNDNEYLIPSIRDVIKNIDLENYRIVINVMEGLLG